MTWIQLGIPSLVANVTWHQGRSTPRNSKWVHPGKLTWNLKINAWNRRFLLETIIFRFHVSFRGGIQKWWAKASFLQANQKGQLLTADTWRCQPIVCWWSVLVVYNSRHIPQGSFRSLRYSNRIRWTKTINHQSTTGMYIFSYVILYSGTRLYFVIPCQIQMS